jgi:hypothetical protein
MNFFAHAVLAAARDPDPRFALGAMLPDLARMAGLEYEALDDAALAAGADFHAQSDEVFHASEPFRSLLASARRELAEAGLPRGGVLAVSHVGVEILLDGWLASDRRRREVFDAALLSGGPAAAERRIRWRREGDLAVWRELLRRLRGGELLDGYADPAFVAERLGGILARRPRLALDAAARRAVARWTPGAQLAVAARAEALLAEVRRALGMA